MPPDDAGVLTRTNTWSLTGGSLDAPWRFDVPGAPTWERPDKGTVADQERGGYPVPLHAVGVTRARRFRLGILLNVGTIKSVRMDELDALWAARGPYVLHGPFAALDGVTVVADPSQGGPAYAVGPYPGSTVVSLGWQEIA